MVIDSRIVIIIWPDAAMGSTQAAASFLPSNSTAATD
jgi:hypothetical protein